MRSAANRGLVKRASFYAAFLLALVTLTAQTPSPQPAASSVGAPIRHLEYAYTIDSNGFNERQYNAARGLKSGVAVSPRQGGQQGTMYVDVTSIAPQGALVIAVHKWPKWQPRPQQTYTCTVYGNTQVTCPINPATTVTNECWVAIPPYSECILLGYLGRRFIEGAPWDANHHWQRKETTDLYDLTEDFTMGDPAGTSTVVNEHETLEIHDPHSNTKQTDDVTIAYDTSKEVPRTIHDSSQWTDRSGSGSAVYDYTLTADSFAPAK